MNADLVPMGLGIAGIALIVAIGKLALVPANRLGIGVFRPYRGDPWPVGVQEDDDARFDWTPRRNRRPPDDAADPSIDVERLAHIDVRRARH
jgi:hypothetical protein